MLGFLFVLILRNRRQHKTQKLMVYEIVEQVHKEKNILYIPKIYEMAELMSLAKCYLSELCQPARSLGSFCISEFVI